MPYNLTRMMSWWRQAGQNNHMGGSFNLDLYLRICEFRMNNPETLTTNNLSTLKIKR
jgi:hypothetical protein